MSQFGGGGIGFLGGSEIFEGVQRIFLGPFLIEGLRLTKFLPAKLFAFLFSVLQGLLLCTRYAPYR
jgi:hypothetical protein